ALTYADAQATPNTDFGLYAADWAKSIFSGVVSLIDTTERLSRNTLGLSSQSACLSYDAFLLQCEMEKTIDAIQTSFALPSAMAIMRKQSLLMFLNERLRHLHAGALDPTYVDSTWGQRAFFDPPETVWCCPESDTDNACVKIQEDACGEGGGESFETREACTNFGCREPEAEEDTDDGSLCPYHSDYIAPGNGFGCDLSVLETGDRRNAYEPVGAEFTAQQAATANVNAARATADRLSQLLRDIEVLSGRDAPPVPAEPADHRIGFGCLLPRGYCEMDPDESCNNSSECEEEGLGSCVLHTGTCERNANVPCSDDDGCSEGHLGACMMTPINPVTIPLRGAFSVGQDITGLLRRFLDLRTLQGESRFFSSDLSLPSELSTESGAAARQQNATPLGTFTSGGRAIARVWSALQGAAEARLFPRSSDPVLETISATRGLRTAVSDLTHMSGDSDALREFVGNFAFFERVQCIFRPCRQKLENVMKIAASDECFPYQNDFLDDTEEDEGLRWKKCVKDACLIIPGVDLDGGHCACFRKQAGADPVEVGVGGNPDYCVARE
ncbi:hypothetical protein HZA45_03065, partial [Candidatus Peregrinibacteria bacterium]|nr:hypothetical protein [Candidatus Peregrinibacteria bacterium]